VSQHNFLRNLFKPKEPLPEPDGPPETEPIVGFRAWKLETSREGVPILYSVVQDFCWLPFEPARGTVEDSEIGAGGGIYAFKSAQDTFTYLDTDSICGSVNLWGTVIEHESGYRAEFAYPKEFWVRKDFDAAMIVRLEETYGVPVAIKEDLPAAPAPPPPMKFSSGLQAGIAEIVRDVIYDREGMTRLRQHLFCRPLGHTTQNAQGVNVNKSWEWTNMVQAGMLPAPNRFCIKAIRVLFLEHDGRPVPVSDAIYWDAVVELRIMMKRYWMSPAGYVADPVVTLGGTDWSKIPPAERMNLIHCLTHPLTAPETAVPGTSSRVSIDGVMIDQQMPFDVQINCSRTWPGREVLVALEGISARAVF
jgi:hypothetical protein